MNTDHITYQSFTQSGYTVVKSAQGLFVTFDHGPLGMAPLFNHGHADALSITLSMRGVPILVDAGTYRYNGVPEYRKYFKGTRAHNTVTIDGQDQAIQLTGFVWDRPYTATLIRTEARAKGLFLEARHNGYTRLESSLTHRRSLLVGDESALLVRDTFSGKGIHAFEQNFHLHPEVIAARSGEWWRVETGPVAIYMRQVEGKELTLHTGENNPPFGWYSPSYGLKVKSGVLSSRIRGTAADVSFITVFCTGAPADEGVLRELASRL